MDGSSDPLVSKYPLIDPQWSSFNMLVEEANKLYYQQRRSIKIKFHLNPRKTEQNGKTPSRTIEGFSSTLKFHLDTKKTIKINFQKYSFKEEAESSFKEDDHVLKKEKRNGLKRTHKDFIDVLDQEWIPCESSNKKQKNSKGCGNSKKQKPKQLSNDAANTTPPDLPQEFKNKINEMGGNQITLVMQKSLYKTDLSPQHNRLSMPLKQIKNESFLREEELRVLEKKQGIEVQLLQPSLELGNISLAKWDMPKLSGPTNSTYVLRSPWIKVATANQLQPNDVVQVWSFRVQQELFMALVKVQA